LEGHTCLGKLAQGTLCNILHEQEIKPHKIRYYLERRDPQFKQKMAEVLCVYRQVKLIKESAAAAKRTASDAVAIVSYDERPGIQAIAATAPDLPPEPGRCCATFASRPNRNSRIVLWLPWTNSIGIPSSIPGPTRSPRPSDMIRTSKSMY
jgi:hypothetical protein